MSFEETPEELANNVASLGFDVRNLIAADTMAIDYVYIERSEIEETGEYNLDGLFVRLNSIIEQVGAKRVALDTLEALFAGLPNELILRAELRRLFRWLKEKGVTVIVTAEQGDNRLTRFGIEEYISDCVIFLDHRVHEQISTRRLRVVKYRGSAHGTNEYPTLINEKGLSVQPISSLGLTYPVSAKRVSTGIPRLDAMMGGKGYYRGSTILISGTAGTGKTSLAAAFADSVCRAGGKFLFISFEESPDQVIRNLRSIGIDLGKWRKSGRLMFHAVRPTVYGLETHLATLHKLVDDFKPDAAVMDPITNLSVAGGAQGAGAMLVRLIDFLKNRGVTSIFTSLTAGGEALEQSGAGISSLMDTWLLVRMLESSGERNRLLCVLKSRGMAHSNQMREFRLSDQGIELLDVYIGEGEVLTGSARIVQEDRDEARAIATRQASQQHRRELEREEASLTAQADEIARRRARIASELEIGMVQDTQREERMAAEHGRLRSLRRADYRSSHVK
jgi:circadian clock protein KaiC